jgi:Zn-dependent metalloprotease
MNEAFSDIFGEAIDILNQDTLDTDTLRTEWPTTCTKTFNSPYGVPPGNDEGHRWAMGEDVITSYENGDGSIRDMYRPDCYFQPSTTLSDYYTCSTYYDNGGVHKNSGILNRLFAVLSDGGQYEDPSAPGTQLRVTGLGLVKSTNLFWRAHEALTPTSQYIDLAIALQDACELSIGRPLYLPNLYNFTITESSEQITDVDCQNVAVALKGSGMDKVGDFCPNIVCEDLYECSWKNCPASTTEIFHEV